MSNIVAGIGRGQMEVLQNRVDQRRAIFEKYKEALAGITGVFLAVDLFVFYLFWELMLVPMYFLIGIWGHERRIYAATKFFLFTQLSGLLMLVAIISLAVLHQRTTGVFTFDYEQLLDTILTPRSARLLMLGVVVAFGLLLTADRENTVGDLDLNVLFSESREFGRNRNCLVGLAKFDSGPAELALH